MRSGSDSGGGGGGEEREREGDLRREKIVVLLV